MCCVVRRVEWQAAAGQKLINNKLEDVSVASDVDCMNECLLHDVCDSINYRSSQWPCQLNTHPDAGVNPEDVVVDSESTHWDMI